jgi:porin-like protein
MKKLILCIVLLPGMATAAEKAKKPAQVNVNPCAQYGAGFVQLKGTTTCVKLSGSVRIDMGTSATTK